jgi:sugar phosphate isomerase/epimerase
MQTALFTVSFAGFWNQHTLTLEQVIDVAADLGYDGVEIMGKRPHLSPLDYDLDACRRLGDAARSRGVRIAAVAAYTDFGVPRAVEVPFGEMQIAYVAALAERAAALGCDLVRVFTAYEDDRTPFLAQWDRTIAALRACCDRAAESGVTIGVQNHHDLAVDTKTYRALLAEIDRPNLTPMFDCWSSHLRGEDVAAEAARLAPRMRLTTIADYVLLPRWTYLPDLVNYVPRDPPAARAVPIGEGDLPYEAFFRALLAHGFDGWASYEMCSPIRGGGSLQNLTSYARLFCEYVRQFETTPLPAPETTAR